MKLFLLLLFPILCYSQIVAVDKIDDFTKAHELQINCAESKNWGPGDKIVKGTFNFVFLSVNQTISKTGIESLYFSLQINPYGTVCLRNGSKVIFLFEDSSNFEASNIMEPECSDKTLTGRYLFSRHDLEILASKKLSKLRIYFDNTYVDYDIKKDKQIQIPETFALLKSKI